MTAGMNFSLVIYNWEVLTLSSRYIDEKTPCVAPTYFSDQRNFH